MPQKKSVKTTRVLTYKKKNVSKVFDISTYKKLNAVKNKSPQKNPSYTGGFFYFYRRGV